MPCRAASARAIGAARTAPDVPGTLQVAHHRARVGPGGGLEGGQLRADPHHRARLGEDLHQRPRPRRGDLDHRLVRLDRDERLVSDHPIPRPDVPAHDLGLLETLAQVGQRETHQPHAIISRATEAICAAVGM
jgi:hypothetical protein